MAAEAERSDVVQDKRVGAKTAGHKAAGKVVAAGVVASAAGLLSLCLLIGRFWGDPMALPSLLAFILLALLFQAGFTVSACGLAAIRKQAVYVYLPVILFSLTVLGLVTGFIGYLVMSGPDVAYLKPAKLDYGWDLDRVSSGLSTCSAKYSRSANMGPRTMKSTMTISVPRRRTPPLSIEMLKRMVDAEPKPQDDGPIRRTSRDAQRLKISGQDAYKVADNMSGNRGMSFTQARYWWYSPKLSRQVNCVVILEGGGSWQLDGIEKMLNSIPTE